MFFLGLKCERDRYRGYVEVFGRNDNLLYHGVLKMYFTKNFVKFVVFSLAQAGFIQNV